MDPSPLSRIYDRKPQLIDKLRDVKRAALYILYEALYDFRLAEPFPFGGFQLVHMPRGFTVAIKVDVLSLHPFCLVDYFMCILKDSLA